MQPLTLSERPGPTDHMSITHVASVSQLDSILSKAKDKLTVIDFHATWCGPCHAIAPTYESLSKQYKNVNFLKCDVDAARDIASRYSIAAMPTFVFLKGSTKVDQVKGANPGALANAIRRHSASSATAFSGKGQTLGGGPAPVDVSHEVKSTINATTSKFANLDPQVKILLGLVAVYVFFWYLG